MGVAEGHGGESIRAGVDVGGTFTDVIAILPDGSAKIAKVLSTPPQYEQGVAAGIEALGESTTRAIGEVIHGTTVATNAVLERRGSTTALVTTSGFRDVLELRRLRVPRLYDPFWVKPPTLVERKMRFEVDERIGPNGEVLRPVRENDVRAVAKRIRDTGAQSVAVCLINSYAFPQHEEIVGAILREELPTYPVTLSVELLREQGEYERTATATVNAYVRPIMARYIDRLVDHIGEGDRAVRWMIMQSSGGLMTAERASRNPVFALESGPAAGVIAARGIGEALGAPNIITLDMGGTTAKASLIEDGEVTVSREYEVGGDLSAGSRLLRGSGELLRVPSIDISEVGAGGGSIAWVDSGGALQVGPESAGAAPGPVCYGRGGDRPTVTDANVVLGYVPEGPLADGSLSISKEKGRASIESLASRLKLGETATALGIHRLANARMMRPLRSVSSERGRDPRDFTLIAYGGAGPLHGVGLAENLGVTRVLVPPMAGVLSAIGLLFARPEIHDVVTCNLDAAEVDAGVVQKMFMTLEERLMQEGSAAQAGTSYMRSAELRCQGQSWNVEIPIRGEEMDQVALSRLVEDFAVEYRRLYGVPPVEGSPVIIRALRTTAAGSVEEGIKWSGPSRSASRPRHNRRMAVFGSEVISTRVLERLELPSTPIDGPLLIDEFDTTVVVPPNWTARRHPPTNSIVIEQGKAADERRPTA